MKRLCIKPLIACCILSGCFASALTLAQTPKEVWQKPTPIFSQKFDWLRLKSDEWLKGDIISMYDDELEFDSDEFGIKTFDWDDVAELRSRFDQQIRFADGRVEQGFLIVKDGHLILLSQGREQHYPLSELLSITSSGENRKDIWDGKVSIGVDISAGNVNQLDYFASAMLQRRTPFTRFRSDLTFNYSKSLSDDSDSVVSDTRRLTSYLDWFYSGRVFLRLLDYEYYSDLQQNIKHRNNLGSSVGYHIINNKRLQWDVTAGPSYQATAYYNNVEDSDPHSGALSLSTLLEYTVSRKTDYILDYQMKFVDDASGGRNHHLKTGFEFDFTDDFEMDLMLYVDRVAKPVAAVAQEAPKPNDYRLIVSIGYDF